GEFECQRATNGNCLLAWKTIYEAPGKHALQAGLDLKDRRNSDQELAGPLLPFTITNLCQFSLTSAHFDPRFGVSLRLRLPELNGAYVVELKSTSGQLLKTISGATANRDVKVHWGLTDEHGTLCTNHEFDTL